MPSLELHGVYKIRAMRPCFIVELTIHDNAGPLDLPAVYCQANTHGRDTQQTAFSPRFLSIDGETVLGDREYATQHPEVWTGQVRLALLMHYLQAGAVISTPYGELTVPVPVRLPQRLQSVGYIAP